MSLHIPASASCSGRGAAIASARPRKRRRRCGTAVISPMSALPARRGTPPRPARQFPSNSGVSPHVSFASPPPASATPPRPAPSTPPQTAAGGATPRTVPAPSRSAVTLPHTRSPQLLGGVAIIYQSPPAPLPPDWAPGWYLAGTAAAAAAVLAAAVAISARSRSTALSPPRGRSLSPFCSPSPCLSLSCSEDSYGAVAAAAREAAVGGTPQPAVECRSTSSGGEAGGDHSDQRATDRGDRAEGGGDGVGACGWRPLVEVKLRQLWAVMGCGICC
eukprot:gene3521-biopygen1657